MTYDTHVHFLIASYILFCLCVTITKERKEKEDKKEIVNSKCKIITVVGRRSIDMRLKFGWMLSLLTAIMCCIY